MSAFTTELLRLVEKKGFPEKIQKWIDENRAYAVRMAELIGLFASVEKKADTYADFYITSYELVNPHNVHPKQWVLLAKDPLFRDKPLYLVTAVQEQKNGEFKRRKFILNAGQAGKIGLLAKKPGQARGRKPQLLLNGKVTFGTLGQYLENMFDMFHVANVFPRVQDLSFEKIADAESRRINKALLTKPVRSGMRFGYFKHVKPALK